MFLRLIFIYLVDLSKYFKQILSNTKAYILICAIF